jgi:CheY-like chemotaxis protein
MKQAMTPTTSPLRLRVSVLGDLRHAEFASVRSWLQEQHAWTTILDGIPGIAADRHRSCGANVDLLLLACSRRGEFNGADLRLLRAAAPLARIVAITGSWCEGPWRRTADLLAGVTVVPWHRFAAWAAVNTRQLGQRRWASWAMPETSTADELADFWSVQPLSSGRGMVLIDADDPESAEALADVVRAGGFSAVWQSPRGNGFIDDISAIVCETNDARPATLARIGELSRQFAPSPVLAVVNFPQVEDIRQIISAGAVAVVGKPFTLHEILAQLEDALRRKRPERQAAA